MYWDYTFIWYTIMLLEHECITKQALFLLYNLLNIYLKKLLNVYKFIKKTVMDF